MRYPIGKRFNRAVFFADPTRPNRRIGTARQVAQRALWLERLNERCCWLLWDGRAIDDQMAILNLDHIPGQTNNTLDKICIIGGMAEDGDITTLGQRLEDAVRQGTHRERAAV